MFLTNDKNPALLQQIGRARGADPAVFANRCCFGSEVLKFPDADKIAILLAPSLQAEVWLYDAQLVLPIRNVELAGVTRITVGLDAVDWLGGNSAIELELGPAAQPEQNLGRVVALLFLRPDLGPGAGAAIACDAAFRRPQLDVGAALRVDELLDSSKDSTQRTFLVPNASH